MNVIFEKGPHSSENTTKVPIITIGARGERWWGWWGHVVAFANVYKVSPVD